MENDLEKDYKPLIAKLSEVAEELKETNAEIGDLLLEAAEAIEALSDFSLDLVDIDGTVIYTIPDGQVKSIMAKSVDDFIQGAIAQKVVDIPREKTLSYEEAEEFEKKYEEDV